MDNLNSNVDYRRGISRIDAKTTKGWLVRGYKNGTRYSKLFSDGKCGGRDGSLQKAVNFRNELASRLSAIPSNPRKKKIVLRDKRNKTGVLGISRLSKKGRDDKKLDFYSVTWRTGTGQQKCTSFSVARHGEQEAFKKAINLRYSELRRVHGSEVAAQIIGDKNLKYINGDQS